MKPTLFVLAAGMGSRYGGLKQLDGLGPNGETIMDYSIFDAIRGGFGKVVFVIRKDFEADFRTKILSKYENHIPVEVVFQSVDDLPEGFVRPEGRTKPWGTNHAVMMAADAVHEPFAVINADDFYGAEAYKTIADYLRSVAAQRNHYCMVGYELKNTLSDYGSVSRGICSVDSNGNLTSMVERTSIERINGKIVFKDENGEMRPLDGKAPVSMNMFGFTPDYFDYSEKYFSSYLKDNIDNPKSEFYIPTMVNKLVNDGTAQMRVLHCPAQWFGVTYKEDRPAVVERIRKLIAAGNYPEKLWK